MNRHVTPQELDHLAERERIRAEIETAIEFLIAQLDVIDGDPEAEPSLGSPDRDLCYSQTSWALGGRRDIEAVNEDGGDIQDEPHDEETDDDDEREPSAGWGHDSPIVAGPGSSYPDHGLAADHEEPDPYLRWSPGGRCAPHLLEVMRQLEAIDRRRHRGLKGNIVPVDFPTYLHASGMITR